MRLQVQAHEKELLYLDPCAYYAHAYDTFRVKLRTLILVLVLLVKKKSTQ